MRYLLSQETYFVKLANSVNCKFISHNFCKMTRRVDFYTAQCEKGRNLLSPKKNSSNHLFSNFFSKDFTFTKFLPKKSESKFP